MSSLFPFEPEDAKFPGANFAQFDVDVQNRSVLRFDSDADEFCYFNFKAPQQMTGALTVSILFYMESGVSGNVQFDASLEAITPADALDLDSETSFDTDNISASTSVPATQGHMKEISLSLSNDDSIQPGDRCQLRLNRNVAVVSDAAGDCLVVNVEIQDAA